MVSMISRGRNGQTFIEQRYFHVGFAVSHDAYKCMAQIDRAQVTHIQLEMHK